MAAQVGRGQQAPIDVHAPAAAPAFVGRADVLAKVTDALGTGPALVLVEGEPGIGKTRLLHEVLRSEQVADRGVLLAACPPLREPFPLGPVVDGLRRLRGSVAGVELSALGGALRPLFPEWADQLPPALEAIDDPKEARHRLFRALTELVERLDVGVLVVEDAHWADTATLEWLLILTSVADHGISAVTTYRPTDVPNDSLLLRLTSRPPVGMSQLRVHLEPLDAEQTRRLIGSMLGADDVSEEFAAFLHERADGIPLAIEESVRLLRDRHDIVRHDGRWTRRLLDELDVPPTVRDSVLERVARQPPESRQVLDAAAVLAAPADEALLTTVAGLDGQQGEHGVAAALASGLLREVGPGRFTFRHVLDAQAVDAAIPASRRRRLHARAADALRTVEPAPVVRLARHCREAGDTEMWCQYAEAAADLALDSGDDRNPVTMLLDLLTSLEHPLDRRARLARKLGEVAFFGAAALGELAGRVVGVLREVLGSDELGQGERGELTLLLGRMLWETGDLSAAYEAYEAAIPDLSHRPDLAVRAMTNLAMPLTPDWPAAWHLHWLERASELLPKVVAPLERLSFAMSRATVLLLLGEDDSWPAVAEFPRSASTRAEQQRIARGWLDVAQLALVWGRYDEARRSLATATEIIQTTGNERLRSDLSVATAYVDWYMGAWEGLHEIAAELATSEETVPVPRLEARLLLGLLDLASGARSAAERQLGVVAGEFARLGIAEPATALVPAALSRQLLADSAAESALALTGPVAEMIARKGVWLWAADVAPVHLDALIGVGRADEAARLADQFAEGIANRDAPAPVASLVLCRAILAEARGKRSEAAELFAQAATAWASLPRPYDELLALERQGRCLLLAGDEDAGLAVLSDIEERLRDLGAKWDADRVAHLLRQHGVEVSRAWKRGPRGYGGQLSPREKEVLALVARGMTNREIGQLLFLSPRTVGVHMGAVMRKLGVSSRTAAAMAATEAGLISVDADSVVGGSSAN